MPTVEIKIIVRDEDNQPKVEVSKIFTKEQLFLNNIGAMNMGTITFKEMFKKILKTEETLQ